MILFLGMDEQAFHVGFACACNEKADFKRGGIGRGNGREIVRCPGRGA